MSEQKPTQAERVAALQAEAKRARTTYQATRQQGAPIGNLTRGQQGGSH
jgi:hypothetical protein